MVGMPEVPGRESDRTTSRTGSAGHEMRTLAVDIETYSSVDLFGSGMYAYAASPDFTVLLLGYAFDDETVEVIDIASGEVIPAEVLAALTDPDIVKTAYNAAFERTCLAAHLNLVLAPEQWRCTMVHAATLGLPGSLEKVGEALALKAEERKLASGRALIRYFCIPCAPTAKNNGRMRNLPGHDPERWALFAEYCAQDVETERTIRRILEQWPVPESENALWALDQKINDRGVRCDLEMVKHAIDCDTRYRSRLEKEALELTGLDNPKSVSQLKDWLEAEDGSPVASLTKGTIPGLIEGTDNLTVKRVLEIRQELSKTSITKYAAMGRAIGSDGRIRGLLQFYGARTGRWTSRLVQLQNLPQNHLHDLALARELVHDGRYPDLELLFNVPDTLSQLIRTALVPSEGCRFIVADFSAIEARVIAWLAREVWRMEVFRTHGKIYEASAAQMFIALLAADPRFYAVGNIDPQYGLGITGIGYHLGGGGDAGITDGITTNYFTTSRFLTNATVDIDAAAPLNPGDLYWGGWNGPNWENWTELGDAGGFFKCPDRGPDAYWTSTDPDYASSGYHGQWDFAWGLSSLQMTNGSWIGITVAAGPYDFALSAPYNAHKHAPATPDPGLTALVKNLAGGFQGGHWQTQFLSCTNWLYSLERSSDLQNWTVVTNGVLGNGTNLVTTDPAPPADQAFYRVSAGQP